MPPENEGVLQIYIKNIEAPPVIMPVFHYFGVDEIPISTRLALTTKYVGFVFKCGVSIFSFAGCNINSRHFPGFGHGDFLILNSEYAKPIILFFWSSIIFTDFGRHFFSTEVILNQNFHAVLIHVVPRKRFRNVDFLIRAFSRKCRQTVDTFQDEA